MEQESLISLYKAMDEMGHLYNPSFLLPISLLSSAKQAFFFHGKVNTKINYAKTITPESKRKKKNYD